MSTWQTDNDGLYLTKEPVCTPSTLIVLAKCCRVWPIAVGYSVGRCGLCGTVPEYFDPEDGEE